jgi:hypothetical protein
MRVQLPLHLGVFLGSSALGILIQRVGYANPGSAGVALALGALAHARMAGPAAATAPPSRRADRGAESSDMPVSGHVKRGS